MLVGVLSIQGDFREHIEVLARLGVSARAVRNAIDLEGLNALVLPGGESTAMSKLLTGTELLKQLKARVVVDDLPMMGTCAGMILAAETVLDGRPDQINLSVFKAAVRRNAIGRQVASCEVDLPIPILGDSPAFRCVFIRPPVVESLSANCGNSAGKAQVLAEWQSKPVLCSQGRHLFATFHPELTGDDRIHKLFIENLG